MTADGILWRLLRWAAEWLECGCPDQGAVALVRWLLRLPGRRLPYW
jgi:hypothetical protein